MSKLTYTVLYLGPKNRKEQTRPGNRIPLVFKQEGEPTERRKDGTAYPEALCTEAEIAYLSRFDGMYRVAKGVRVGEAAARADAAVKLEVITQMLIALVGEDKHAAILASVLEAHKPVVAPDSDGIEEVSIGDDAPILSPTGDISEDDALLMGVGVAVKPDAPPVKDAPPAARRPGRPPGQREAVTA